MLLAYSFRRVKYCISQSLSRTIKLLINRILLYLARIEGIYLGNLLNLSVIIDSVWQASWRKEAESQVDASFDFLWFFSTITFLLLQWFLHFWWPTVYGGEYKMYNYYEINVHYDSHSMVDIILFCTSPA